VAHWTTRSITFPLSVPSAPGRSAPLAARRDTCLAGARSPRGLRERLQLEELVQARAAHLAAGTRLLVTAERRVGAVVHATVRAHGADPNPRRDAEGALAVGAQHAA